jgi:hypothetical protein
MNESHTAVNDAHTALALSWVLAFSVSAAKCFQGCLCNPCLYYPRSHISYVCTTPGGHTYSVLLQKLNEKVVEYAEEAVYEQVCAIA